MQYVIIGGSIAGISAARSIRTLDAGAEITIVSAEKAKPYYRPMITAVIDQSAIDISINEDFAAAYRIRTLHDRAEGLDPRAKKVRLASGGRLPYDRLLIAAGSSPVFPDVPGLEGGDVFPLRNLADAQAIRSAAVGKRTAVVLGGGFVGIKAAIALRRLGLEVTIIEKLDRILYEKLDKHASSILAERLKREGIEIVTNQQDYDVLRTGGVLRSVRLASGRILDTDLIVAAVGTKPNDGAFREAGIRANRGIIVNETLETSIEGVYAAGDVVEYRDSVSNMPTLSGLWTNAEEMGRLAGKSMAGKAVRYRGFLSLMNTIDVLNVPVTMMGLVAPQANGHEVHAEGDRDVYRKLVFKDDVLKGALFIGGGETRGVYMYLIRNRVPLGRMKEPAFRGTVTYADFLGACSAGQA